MTSRGQLSIHFQQLIQNFGFIHIYIWSTDTLLSVHYIYGVLVC